MHSSLLRVTLHSLLTFWLLAGTASLLGQNPPGRGERIKHDVSPALRDIPRKAPQPGPPRQVLNMTRFRPIGPLDRYLAALARSDLWSAANRATVCLK